MNMQFESMSREELVAKRKEFKELLDEYVEERGMLLGQTGQHVGGTKIVKKYAALIEETEDSIAELEKLIDTPRG